MIVVGTPGRHKQSDLIIRKESEREDKDRNEVKPKRTTISRTPTPADEYVPPEVFLLEDKGES